MPAAHGYCTWTRPVPATMVIVCVPTVMAVAGLELKRPWVSNWNEPVGLAVVLAGAVSAIAEPSALSKGVDQVVSAGLQALPDAACWAAE
jgi:hypothetical protein